MDYGEIPKEAVVRETKEEIIHEDSNYDRQKDMIFICLVNLCNLDDSLEHINLDLNEHSEYKLIKNLDDLKDN